MYVTGIIPTETAILVRKKVNSGGYSAKFTYGCLAWNSEGSNLLHHIQEWTRSVSHISTKGEKEDYKGTQGNNFQESIFLLVFIKYFSNL